MTMPPLVRHAARSGIRRGGGPHRRSVGADNQPICTVQQRQWLSSGEPRAACQGNPELQWRIAIRYAETTTDRLPRAGSTGGQSCGVPPAFPRGAAATVPRGCSVVFADVHLLTVVTLVSRAYLLHPAGQRLYAAV